jgi:hypothetical protein
MIFDQSTRFRPVRWRPKLLLVAPLGYLAELGASLPFRLFPAQVNLLAQRLGLRPRARLPRAEVVALAARIDRDGWDAYPVTREMFAWLAPAAPREGR